MKQIDGGLNIFDILQKVTTADKIVWKNFCYEVFGV